MRNVKIDVDKAIEQIEQKSGKKITAIELSEQLGLGGTKTLRNWKNGEYLNKIAQLKELSRLSGMTLDELVKYE